MLSSHQSGAQLALAEYGHDGPTVDPILRIHRGKDGHVTFHQFRNKVVVNDWAVMVSDLESIFPQFRADLQSDSFFSLNSFYRPGSGAGIAGLPRAAGRRRHAGAVMRCNKTVSRKRRVRGHHELA